jgi:hypothetical protein
VGKGSIYVCVCSEKCVDRKWGREVSMLVCVMRNVLRESGDGKCLCLCV